MVLDSSYQIHPRPVPQSVYKVLDWALYSLDRFSRQDVYVHQKKQQKLNSRPLLTLNIHHQIKTSMSSICHSPSKLPPPSQPQNSPSKNQWSNYHQRNQMIFISRKHSSLIFKPSQWQQLFQLEPCSGSRYQKDIQSPFQRRSSRLKVQYTADIISIKTIHDKCPGL